MANAGVAQQLNQEPRVRGVVFYQEYAYTFEIHPLDSVLPCELTKLEWTRGSKLIPNSTTSDERDLSLRKTGDGTRTGMVMPAQG